MKLGTVIKSVTLAGAIAFASSAMADGGPRGSVKDRAPRAAPAYNWSGFYIGLHGGYAYGEQDVAWAPNPVGFPVSGPALTALGSGGINGSSFAGGAQIGFNWQIQNLVVGVEGDWSWLDVSGSRTADLATTLGPPSAPIRSTFAVDWVASVRARLGLAFDNWLVYATGGVAWADMSVSDRVTFNASNTFNAAAGSDTVTGYVIGAGVEWAFQRNWTLRGEFLHYGFDDLNVSSRNSDIVTFPNANIAHSHRNTDINVIRAGINYKF